MALTKLQILSMQDLKVKEITVPHWNDTLFIRQLTRAEQDEYLKRQYGSARLRSDKTKAQEIQGMNIYGHDAWLVSVGACDENGARIFEPADVVLLEKKNGEAIGYIASEIVKFSQMQSDVDAATQLKN